MFVKIFIDASKKIKEEIFFKLAGNTLAVHFKAQTAEMLETQIGQFAGLAINWQKLILCKSALLPRKVLLEKLIATRSGIIDIALEWEHILPKIYKQNLTPNTDYFMLFNNISRVSLKPAEVAEMRRFLF